MVFQGRYRGNTQALRTKIDGKLVIERADQATGLCWANPSVLTLLIRPDEVLSCILNSGVAKVAHHSLRRALKHRHVIVSRFA